MKKLIYGLIVILAILHQDFWWWESDELIFGFLPISLAWHIGISISAAILWALAVKYCWPSEVEEEASAFESARSGGDAP